MSSVCRAAMQFFSEYAWGANPGRGTPSDRPNQDVVLRQHPLSVSGLLAAGGRPPASAFPTSEPVARALGCASKAPKWLLVLTGRVPVRRGLSQHESLCSEPPMLGPPQLPTRPGGSCLLLAPAARGGPSGMGELDSLLQGSTRQPCCFPPGAQRSEWPTSPVSCPSAWVAMPFPFLRP